MLVLMVVLVSVLLVSFFVGGGGVDFDVLFWGFLYSSPIWFA